MELIEPTYNNTKICTSSDIFRPIRAATTNAATSKITNSYQPQYDNRDISRARLYTIIYWIKFAFYRAWHEPYFAPLHYARMRANRRILSEDRGKTNVFDTSRAEPNTFGLCRGEKTTVVKRTFVLDKRNKWLTFASQMRRIACCVGSVAQLDRATAF